MELSQGNFPVKHPADYLTVRDATAYQTTKPRIQPLQKLSKLPRLRVTIAITSSTVLDSITRLQRPTSCFVLEVAGFDLTFLTKKRILLALRSLKDFSFPLDHLYVHLHDLSELPSEELTSLPLSPSTCLWLITPTAGKLEHHVVSDTSYVRVFSQILRSTPALKGLVIDSDDFRVLTVLSNSVALPVSALCMLRRNGESQLDLNEKTKEVLQTFIPKNASSLQYFQIHGCYLSMLPMDSLKLCANLRVLSMTQYNTHGNRPINIISNPSDVLEPFLVFQA